ncbi:phage minor capsid protein [Streptomyces sp. NPDC101206]|uniref:phage minor capsid protein n=1 Tax=Streptomyces sp. NPDC101206 TaxID=3366128 RepID=UPI003819CBF0
MSRPPCAAVYRIRAQECRRRRRTGARQLARTPPGTAVSFGRGRGPVVAEVGAVHTHSCPPGPGRHSGPPLDSACDRGPVPGRRLRGHGHRGSGHRHPPPGHPGRMRRWADEEITSFRDRAGRRWQLTSYAEMAVRTATGHAATEARMRTLAEHGVDLVIVSDSPLECPLCRPWEGKVFPPGRMDQGVRGGSASGGEERSTRGRTGSPMTGAYI